MNELSFQVLEEIYEEIGQIRLYLVALKCQK
jgi:hypothetical protein